MKQLALLLPQRGGKRNGAGRKRKAAGPRVSHKPRPAFEKAAAVLVTLRVASVVWNLRSRRCYEAIQTCLINARGRFGLRVIELSVLGNHLHLLVEADCDQSLYRGMQGLCVRIARALNRLWRCAGQVFPDRFHSRMLATPRAVRTALVYVLRNARKHGSWWGDGADEYSSGSHFEEWRSRTSTAAAAPEASEMSAVSSSAVRHQLERARTWLLSTGWRRRGLIAPDERPASE